MVLVQGVTLDEKGDGKTQGWKKTSYMDRNSHAFSPSPCPECNISSLIHSIMFKVHLPLLKDGEIFDINFVSGFYPSEGKDAH